MENKKAYPSYSIINYWVTLYDFTQDEIGKVDIDEFFQKKLENNEVFIFDNYDAAMEFSCYLIENSDDITYAMIDLCVWDDSRENCISSVCVGEVFSDIELPESENYIN